MEARSRRAGLQQRQGRPAFETQDRQRPVPHRIQRAVHAQCEIAGRGNSGAYIQDNYEIQILDSFENPTYANGSCAALYGQYAPLVNACRKPGEWQSYDIVFHAPACDASGQVTTPATLTVLHNGVLVQDHVTIKGKTPGAGKTSVCEPGPLMLQDHFHPDVKETFMKFRNIWYRSL